MWPKHNSAYRVFWDRFHPFHIVDPSPWPFLAAGCLFSMVCSFVGYLYGFEGFIEDFFLHVWNLSISVGFWWRDVIREGTFGGHHTPEVQRGIKMGFGLFLVSEVMFFFSFFWALFYLAVHPSSNYLGTFWSKHIYNETIQANHIPLYNTCALLLSSVTLTFAHYGLMKDREWLVVEGLLVTLILGAVFLYYQRLEYQTSKFDISDGAFGSSFYLLTGFHGVHVVIGWIFLFFQLIRYEISHFTPEDFMGFELAIWYWHFVDIIWLAVFISVYSYGTYPTSDWLPPQESSVQ